MVLHVFTAMGALAMVQIAPAQPTASPTHAPVPSAQQMFDAGEDATLAGRDRQAAEMFAALEARLSAPGKPPSHSLAVARLRLGESLARLGRDAEAVAKLDPAAAGLDKPADVALRREALVELGRAELATFASSAAAGHFRAALALPPPGNDEVKAADNLDLRTLIARAAMFDDPARVAADLKAGLPQAQKLLADNKPGLARYMQLYGRALLNAGMVRPARAAFDKAILLTGGLTEKVMFVAQSMRADGALAAQVAKDDEEAARFTAYTGAGMTQRSNLKIPADAEPPPCGGIAELRPDDYAVVQFTLRDDGVVVGAEPVYASRTGPMALAFAQAVAGWSWTPDSARAIQRFFRSAARLEMRCTTRADRQSVADLLKPEFEAWAATQGAPPIPDAPSAAASVARLRAALADVEQTSGAASAKLVPLLIALARNPALSPYQQALYAQRAQDIATGAVAPPAVLAWVTLTTFERFYSYELHNDRFNRKQVNAIIVLARSQRIAPDPKARAAIELVASDVAYGGRDLPTAQSLLEGVIALPLTALHVDDPIRPAAAIRLASLQAATGAREAAAATFASSGIAPNQCALLDQSPVVLARHASDSDYPTVLQHFGSGFEGWAITEFDVTREGRTENARVLIAYPPFLFGPAAAGISKRTQYRPSFRPDGALSCGGYRDRVVFKAADLAK